MIKAFSPQTISRLGPPMAWVLIASVLLGFAYNAASPLGVRSSNSAVQSSREAPVPAKAIPATGYYNETVSLVLEGGAPSGSTAPGRTVPSLAWPEVKGLLRSGEILLIDARVAAYYQAEHIPGAISLPANSPPADIAAFATQHPKNAPVVVYCGSTTCPMAHQLADVLVGQHGYSNVKLMPGGFAEYRLAETQAGTGGAH
jgi:rhodanese-related sulfurtransferase